jgi:hypothetical protein
VRTRPSPRPRPQHRRPGWRRRQLAWAGVTVALLATATTAVLLTRSGDPADESSDASAVSTSGTGSADAASADLLAWAARELPAEVRLRTDAGTRDGLLDAGAPAALLEDPATIDPDTLVLDVGTGAVPSGARELARFGELVVVDPSPGVPTADQLERRRDLAAALLANPTVQVGGTAAAVLSDLEVDARLLTLLAALGAQQGVGVADFPGVSGAVGLPARSALLDSFGGVPVGEGEPATEALLTWLDAQLPPFAPDEVTVTADGVLLGHRYASDPDAAVSDAGS